MMKSKIIQLSSCAVNVGDIYATTLYALCEDGSVLQRMDEGWVLIPNVIAFPNEVSPPPVDQL